MPPPPVPKKKHERGVVTVTVVAARNLRDMERFGKMDPYVTVRLEETSRSTAVVKGGGCACEFGNELVFHVEERPMSLCVDVFDKEKVGSDDHVGSGEVTLTGKKIVGAGLSETVALHEDYGEVDVEIRFQHDGTPLTLSGHLEKKSSSWPRWDRRWFELRGTLFVYYHEDASGSKRAAGEVSLLECTDVRSSTVPDARDAEWELLHEARTYRFAAGSDEEALAWIEACRAHIPAGDGPQGADSAEVGTPTRDDQMTVSEGTPRGRSAPGQAATVRKYLSAMTGKPAKGQDLFEALKSGALLCELANKCVPGAVLKFTEDPQSSIVEMENISIFLASAPKLGVEEDLVFECSDLWDGITVATERAKVLATLARLAELYPAAK